MPGMNDDLHKRLDDLTDGSNRAVWLALGCIAWQIAAVTAAGALAMWLSLGDIATKLLIFLGWLLLWVVPFGILGILDLKKRKADEHEA